MNCVAKEEGRAGWTAKRVRHLEENLFPDSLNQYFKRRHIAEKHEVAAVSKKLSLVEGSQCLKAEKRKSMSAI